MTRDPVGRRGVGIVDTIRRLDAGTILTTVLVLGLVLRVLIAGVYMPLSGFAIDIGDFTAWGQRLASVGPAAFYEEGYFSDYPPGYLYVLWLLGGIGGALTPLVGQDATGGLVKIPGILADIGVAWLLFATCRRWGSQLADRARLGVAPQALGLVAATAYLFNPGVIFDSAVWGQIDSVGTLVLLATIYALARGWTEAAAFGAVLALLVKFQFAFLIPIVAIVGLKRHLFARSADPLHRDRPDLLRVLTSLAAGVVPLVAMMLPFGMTIYAPRAGGDPRGLLGLFPEADPTTSLIGKLAEAAGTYTGLSINAFNLWRNPWSGLGDTLHWGDDTVAAITLGGIGLTWQHVGTVLFAAAAIIALVVVARRDDVRGVLLAALLLAVAFFVLPTRVHERYLFPALALAAPLLFAGRSWPWIYGGLSLSFFANVYWVYTEDWSFAGPRVMNPGLGGAPMEQDGLLSATLLTDAGIWALSFLSVVLLGAVVWHALRLAASHASEPVPTPPSASEPEPVVGAPAPIAPRAPAPADWGATRVDPAASGDGRGPRWLAPNPADAYLREPGRRLDRRDAWLLLALVLFALVFRLWRLDVPRGHHFDEVYHARSAAEWLANWQHGWDRDVYEWTHPMLAKYLIAGGIVLADPNRVIDSDELDEPSPTLAVAPARAAFGRDRSVAFTLSGTSTVVATDAESGDELARWQAGGPVAALAYDPEAPRLLVGRADAGTVETYELAGLLASPDGRAPPSGPPIEVDLAAVNQVVVLTSSGSPILLRGPDGVATVDPASDEVTARASGTYGGIGLVRGAEDDPDRVAVSDVERGSIAFLDAATLQPLEDGTLEIGAALVGPILVRGGGDDQQLLALTGPLPATEEHPATRGGIAAVDADEERLVGLVPLPGAPTLIADQRLANLVYVAGTTPEGDAQVWVVEPHVERRGDGTIGMATFDATDLPGTPVAMAFDIATTGQADDHGRLLVATADGTLVHIDAGSTAFAWRLAGVVFGAILVGLVYLLAATMFSRRGIALLAAAFVAVDGMSYVMSRIAMNDIFVAVFIVAAYLLFWQVWSGRWSRSAWWVLPLVGVLIGLAAATKWVGFYALFGLLVLVLARSSLGRLVLVGLAALSAVVGGIGAPWPFLVTMLGVLALALVIAWARPIRMPWREALVALSATAVVVSGVTLAFVLGFGSVEGRTPGSAVEYLFGLLARGVQAGWPAWLMVGVAAILLAWRAWASVRDPSSDARWFRPGEMGGFAWAWVGASLLVVPLVVYGLSYLPYLQLGHEWAVGGGPGYGWSLDELHAQMFGYHFNLTAGHDSASPWWSWPLALKPTWFFGGTAYDADQIAVIYNGGNPLLFWAGIPAVVTIGVLAWKRRSPALVLLVAAFAFQYVPWIRIERATFAYHYLTAVIFAMVAVAYVVDELLRRPAWRDIAIGYLALVVVAGILIFPLNSALAMPDWYVNAARALPPWNFGFQFPDPPQGERAELLTLSGLKLAAGAAVAAGAMLFALAGRDWWERRQAAAAPPAPDPMPEGG
ncbi:MAG TPA: phospholipid carrier-dependent glycosyltransferase [Candidatus Limnocylindria bacterium]|nr:phospholipid carrier-dependent glycosyltransferase [Candidatus Limnocylindria bacterium]